MLLLEGHFSINLRLNGRLNGQYLRKSPIEGRKFLDSIIEYATFIVKPRPLWEVRKSGYEDLLAYPSPSTFLDLAIEPLPEPEILEGEEIRHLKFSSQFEDDPSKNHRNTSNFFDT
jgi:hypothetical protein